MKYTATRVESSTLCGRWLFISLISATLTACGGSSGGDSGDVAVGAALGGPSGAPLGNPSVEQCSVADINRWIDARMRDDYLYYDQVPVVNLDDYTDPAKLVADLRVDPDTYSSVVDQQRNVQLIENSTVTRFGFWVRRAGDGVYRFADVSGNSPMQKAGVERGDKLLAVNGVDYETLTREQYQEFVAGEPEESLTAVFTIQKPGAAAIDIEVTKQSYIETTVREYGTYAQTDDQVAYLRVDAFRGTTPEELDEAMANLAAQNISELILDLRYNGGGFTRTARQLASQIAGDAFAGQVYSTMQFNDKYSQNNIELLIERQNVSLGLSRLFVLTTAATASASELLINGLAPLIDVVVIGDQTTGKPFTSVAQDYCGKRLNAMSTITTNGAGDSVLGGITPTCVVADNFLTPTDDINDALTGAAFDYLLSGTCPVADVELASSDTGSSELVLQAQ